MKSSSMVSADNTTSLPTDEIIHEENIGNLQTMQDEVLNTLESSIPIDLSEPSEEEQINLTLAMCEATGIEFEDAQKALRVS
jgi:antitoxin component of RelBE/YafQ-DinJ toxin-antitoxin module